MKKLLKKFWTFINQIYQYELNILIQKYQMVIFSLIFWFFVTFRIGLASLHMVPYLIQCFDGLEIWKDFADERQKYTSLIEVSNNSIDYDRFCEILDYIDVNKLDDHIEFVYKIVIVRDEDTKTNCRVCVIDYMKLTDPTTNQVYKFVKDWDIIHSVTFRDQDSASAVMQDEKSASSLDLGTLEDKCLKYNSKPNNSIIKYPEERVINCYKDPAWKLPYKDTTLRDYIYKKDKEGSDEISDRIFREEVIDEISIERVFANKDRIIQHLDEEEEALLNRVSPIYRELADRRRNHPVNLTAQQAKEWISWDKEAKQLQDDFNTAHSYYKQNMEGYIINMNSYTEAWKKFKHETRLLNRLNHLDNISEQEQAEEKAAENLKNKEYFFKWSERKLDQSIDDLGEAEARLRSFHEQQ